MKVLVFLTLAALVAAEAEPEADPQFPLNAGYTFAPFAPLNYVSASAYPYAAGMPHSTMPYMHNNYNTWPYMFPTVAKPAEAARAKREAEADPDFFINPLVSFNADDTPLPLSYSFPTVEVPAVSPVTYSAGAWPAAWSGSWPAIWSDAWSHHGLLIGYAQAKMTQ